MNSHTDSYQPTTAWDNLQAPRCFAQVAEVTKTPGLSTATGALTL